MPITTYRCTLVQIRNSCNCPKLPEQVKDFLNNVIKLCKPKTMHVCDGSTCEANAIKEELQCSGMLKPLPKYNECSLLKIDPKDGESGRIYLVSDEKSKSVPDTKCGLEARMKTRWLETSRAEGEIEKIFCNCMEGKTLWVIPYALGVKGSHLSSVGLQLTDSPLVALWVKSLGSGMGGEAMQMLNNAYEIGGESTKRIFLGLHSIGKKGNEECEEEKDEPVIYHDIEKNQVFSYGSLWPTMSVLADEPHGLRLASKWSHLDSKKGTNWETAVKMSLISIKDKDEKTFYFGTGFGSKSTATEPLSNMETFGKRSIELGKISTNTTWLMHDRNKCSINAIDPYSGALDRVSGISCSGNPKLTSGMVHHTIFLNTGETVDGGVYWRSLGKNRENSEGNGEEAEAKIFDYEGKPWSLESGKAPEHPEAKYLTPIKELNNYDIEAREKSTGVPLSGFIFQTDRPVKGAPLVMQVKDWNQGVLFGLGMRYEDCKGELYWDPFYMRDLFGYNYCNYLKHLLKIGHMEGLKATPMVFLFNSSALDQNGEKWPGGLANIRVVEWILKRLKEDNESGIESEITGGIIPNRDEGYLDLKGIDWGKEDETMDPKKKLEGEINYWKGEVDFMRDLIEEEFPYEAPYGLRKALDELGCRLETVSMEKKKEMDCEKEGKGKAGKEPKEKDLTERKKKTGVKTKCQEKGKKRDDEKKGDTKTKSGDKKDCVGGGMGKGGEVSKTHGKDKKTERNEGDGRDKGSDKWSCVGGDRDKAGDVPKTDAKVPKTDAKLPRTDAKEAKTCANVPKTDPKVTKTDAKVTKTDAKVPKTDAKTDGRDRPGGKRNGKKEEKGNERKEVCGVVKEGKDEKKEGVGKKVVKDKIAAEKGKEEGKLTCDEADSKELSSATREILGKSKVVLRVLGRKALRGTKKAAVKMTKKITKSMDRTIESGEEKKGEDCDEERGERGGGTTKGKEKDSPGKPGKKKDGGKKGKPKDSPGKPGKKKDGGKKGKPKDSPGNVRKQDGKKKGSQMKKKRGKKKKPC